jgi:NAD(P)-dependent dehydrogenase (short-subunit alcohol dehydrogenase family)
MKDLRGKVAFITGGAQGIGLGMARALKAEGALLALVDIDQAALDAAAKELDAATYVLDVRDRDAYAVVVDDVEANVGPIAILCSNAGVGGGASVTQMTYEMWDWVLGVNNGGVVNGIQTIVPRMVERGEGHVVNTASGAGLVSTDGTGFMYNMSKYAVVGLSECIRHDLAKRGIGVSVLCPGPVATDIFEHTEAGRPRSARAHARPARAVREDEPVAQGEGHVTGYRRTHGRRRHQGRCPLHPHRSGARARGDEASRAHRGGDAVTVSPCSTA